MEFFKKIEKKLKRKYILYTFSMFILSALFAITAVNTGFSSKKNTKIVLRGTDAGVAVSDGLLSIFFIIMAIAFLIGALYCLKAIVNNRKYNVFIQETKEIGDIHIISEALTKTEKSKLAKGGELFYNNHIVLFLEGIDITVINPKSIIAIKANMLRDKNYIKPYVSIYYDNNVIHIETQRNKNEELCNDIINKCNLGKGVV